MLQFESRRKLPTSKINSTNYRHVGKISQQTPIVLNEQQLGFHKIFKISNADIIKECLDRYELCEEELSKRFDLKGINVYNLDTQNNFTDDIIRVGGNI